MNRFADAIDSFDRALALNPGDKKTLNARSYAGKRLLPVQYRQAGHNTFVFAYAAPFTGYLVFKKDYFRFFCCICLTMRAWMPKYWETPMA